MQVSLSVTGGLASMSRAEGAGSKGDKISIRRHRLSPTLIEYEMKLQR